MDQRSPGAEAGPGGARTRARGPSGLRRREDGHGLVAGAVQLPLRHGVGGGRSAGGRVKTRLHFKTTFTRKLLSACVLLLGGAVRPLPQLRLLRDTPTHSEDMPSHTPRSLGNLSRPMGRLDFPYRVSDSVTKKRIKSTAVKAD